MVTARHSESELLPLDRNQGIGIILVTQTSIQAVFDQAVAFHEKNQLVEAQDCYMHVLQAVPEHPDALHLLGVCFAQSGDFANARSRIEHALILKPANGVAHNNLGNVLRELGQAQAAVSSYDRAVALLPNYPDAWCNRGIALHGLGQNGEAVRSFQRAIAARPVFPQAYCHWGDACLSLNQPEAALQCYAQALVQQPDFADAWFKQGLVFQQLGRSLDAVSSYQQAVALDPAHGGAFCNLGNVLQTLGRYEEALDYCARGIALLPLSAEAYSNRGVVLRSLERIDEALSDCRRALELDPKLANAHNNLGMCLRLQGKNDEALACYVQAIALQPDHASAYANQGNVLWDSQMDTAAMQCYAHALVLNPDDGELRFNLSLMRLQRGDFAQGWQDYEVRLRNRPPGLGVGIFSAPQWRGESEIQGQTVLLHCEQGAGDTLQFCRYAGMVAQLGARVVLEAPPALAELLISLDGVSQMVPKGAALPPYDWQCPLLSLPLAFQTRLDSIPAPPRYLSASASRLEKWRSILGPATRRRIGLTWSGQAKHRNDRNRNVPLETFLRLLPPQWQYISLQTEVRETDQPALSGAANLLHFGAALEDFADTAALCELVDAVVSVDTSSAHLAGALGCPVHIVLPFNSDWRWLRDRDDTPWYPSARLYRQTGWNTHEAAIGRIVAELLK